MDEVIKSLDVSGTLPRQKQVKSTTQSTPQGKTKKATEPAHRSLLVKNSNQHSQSSLDIYLGRLTAPDRTLSQSSSFTKKNRARFPQISEDKTIKFKKARDTQSQKSIKEQDPNVSDHQAVKQIYLGDTKETSLHYRRAGRMSQGSWNRSRAALDQMGFSNRSNKASDDQGRPYRSIVRNGILSPTSTSFYDNIRIEHTVKEDQRGQSLNHSSSISKHQSKAAYNDQDTDDIVFRKTYGLTW